MIQELTVIGLMSGTSLDGLDICCVNFSSVHNKYQYQILASQTIAYPGQISKASRSPSLSKLIFAIPPKFKHELYCSKRS